MSALQELIAQKQALDAQIAEVAKAERKEAIATIRSLMILHSIPEIKLEDVRAVLADKSRMGHTAAVRELLTKYGAAKLSEIDPQKYPALLKDAERL